jgi:hypothetical protein
MRRLTLILTTAAVAVAPATASAQSTVPVPDPILTKLGKTPMVELWDGGGGLPYLGSSVSYNAGDWENALRTYHDSGVYERQIAKVDAVAAQWIRRAGNFKKFHFKAKWRHRSARRALIAMGHGDKHRGHGKKKRAMVFDIDETTLSNYTAIEKDNFTFGTNSQNEAQNQVGEGDRPVAGAVQPRQEEGLRDLPDHRPARERAHADRPEPRARGLQRIQTADPQAAGLHRLDRRLQVRRP